MASSRDCWSSFGPKLPIGIGRTASSTFRGNRSQPLPGIAAKVNQRIGRNPYSRANSASCQGSHARWIGPGRSAVPARAAKDRQPPERLSEIERVKRQTGMRLHQCPVRRMNERESRQF